MPRFTVMLGRDVLDTYNLVKDRILIGRTRRADIVLDNLMISREHAEIVRTGKSYVVNALAGKNGVFVNGQWIDTQILRDGDIIELGKFVVKFEYPREEKEKLLSLEREEAGSGLRVTTTEMLGRIEEDERQDAERRMSPQKRKAKFADSKADTLQLRPDELAKVRGAMDQAKRAQLVMSTPQGQRNFPMTATGVRIGKGSECDVRIYTGWLAPRVSAEVVRASGGGFAVDVKGGAVKLNDEVITGVRRLDDKDVIEVEGTKLTYYAALK